MKVSTFLCLFCAIMMLSPAVRSQTDNGKSLQKLLEQVRQSGTLQSRQHREREARFLQEHDNRKKMLEQARAQLRQEQKRENSLKSGFNENEKTITDLEQRLHIKMGSLGELFGVVRQVSGDTLAILQNSLVSAQKPDRIKPIQELANQKSTPDIAQLEALWLTLQDEMTHSGGVVRFNTAVLNAAGVAEDKTVTRVGVFTAVADGKYLRYIPETGQLVELSRQPPSRYRQLAAGLEKAGTGLVPMALDPSRGTILSLLVQTPDLSERIQQGKFIGYMILVLAFVGLLVALVRIVQLQIIGARIRAQIKSDSPSDNNPLGKIMSVYHAHKNLDTDSLAKKLDEAILHHIPPLQRGLSTIKILAMIAPLLGLLGTVTGMIDTFQSITLFGTGDPKLMAGGISQALVTTALGLIAAIPLILLHTMVNSKSKQIISVLDEQSAGIIAQQAERVAG